MTDFKPLCRKLADRLRDTTEFLAPLHVKGSGNIIMKNWDILIEVENELADPDND